MPGMGLHQHCGMNLEQKLEMRCDLRLALTQIEGLSTDGTENAEEQAKLLKRFLEELDRGVYIDLNNFYDRCMKRIKKEDRSESVKAVVKNLREVIDAYAPQDIMGVKALLQYGISAFETNHWVPSVEFEQLTGIFKTREKHETRKFALNFMTRKLNRDVPGNYAHLLSSVSEHRCVDDDTFMSVIQSAENANPRTIDFLGRNITGSLPENANKLQFKTAFDTIYEFEELIPEQYQDSTERMVKNFVKHKKLPELVKNYSIPLPLLAAVTAFNPDESQLRKLEALCSEERVTRGRDTRRRLMIGAHQLTNCFAEGASIFSHTLELAKNAEQLEKLYSEIASALMASREKYIDCYNFSAKTFEELYAHLRNGHIATGLGAVPISEAHRQKLVEDFDRIPSKFITIISTLGQVYQKNYPEGLSILAKIAESVIDGNFSKWRYSHEKAAAQLLSAANSQAWQQNIFRTHVLKCPDSVREKLNAVRMIGKQAYAEYRRVHGDPEINMSNAIRELASIEELLRDPKTADKKALGIRAAELRHGHNLAQALELFNIEPSQIELTRSFLIGKVKDRKYGLLCAHVQSALECLNSPDLNNLETITVEEADHYMSLLNVGVEPVQSCQRWTEPTGFNKCLLAYVADANKKVFYTRTKSGTTLARAVVRIVPSKKNVLTLLLEPVYSTTWSNDHAMALVSTVLEKAAKISEELGQPVRVGYTDRRGDYDLVFKQISAKTNVPVKRAKLEFNLPESVNHFEYSDALGGCLKSGSHVSGDTLHYLTVGPDEEE